MNLFQVTPANRDDILRKRKKYLKLDKSNNQQTLDFLVPSPSFRRPLLPTASRCSGFRIDTSAEPEIGNNFLQMMDIKYE